ncbi:MAG: iron ABC transporter permease [Thermoprotei archaeon]|nr:iron ABC transporter permease [Thermoprotei archaeon]
MKLRFLSALTTALLILILLLVASLGVGPYKVYSPHALVRAVFEEGPDRAVIEYRLWRSIAAFILGLGLAVSGLALQRLINNPLADPYILGISSGASLGFLAAVALGLKPLWVWYLAAFSGGLLAYTVIVAVATALGLTGLGLIVSGVSLTYAFTGVSMILIYVMGPQIQFGFSWLFGSVAYSTRDVIVASTFLTLTGLAIIAYYRGSLTTLLLGEDVARALGVKVHMVKLIVSASIALIVASLVAVSGPVGFIGLIAPWIARLAVGAGFTRLLPLTAAAGASLGLASDILVRIAGGGRELPLTALTAIIGAPLLFYLTLKTKGVERL